MWSSWRAEAEMADKPRTIVSSFFGYEPQTEAPQEKLEANNPPLRLALWARLHRLQRMPDPVMHSDANEREKSKKEWASELPELVDELFWKAKSVLGEKEARSLFELTLKRPPSRPPHPYFKALALDLYDAEQGREIAARRLVSHTAAILKRMFPEKEEETIRRELREFISERKRKTEKTELHNSGEN
jgi:hypothetical protein